MGFTLLKSIREVVNCFGDQLLNLNELVQEPLVPSDLSSPGKFVSAALGKNSFPCTLIVYWQERLHYTSIRIESTSNIWHLDSKQRKPRKLTMRMVQDIMIDKSCYTFLLVRKPLLQPSPYSSENPGKLLQTLWMFIQSLLWLIIYSCSPSQKACRGSSIYF